MGEELVERRATRMILLEVKVVVEVKELIITTMVIRYKHPLTPTITEVMEIIIITTTTITQQVIIIQHPKFKGDVKIKIKHDLGIIIERNELLEKMSFEIFDLFVCVYI